VERTYNEICLYCRKCVVPCITYLYETEDCFGTEQDVLLVDL